MGTSLDRMDRRTLVVAIDGPSGSGKSTVARGVAARLGLRYLDTGAMYRAVTWLALDRGVQLDDPAALTTLAEAATLEVTTDPEQPAIVAAGTDVTAAVRGAEVTAAVSQVSAVAGVRDAMVRRQRELIGAGGIVVEGRDIGSTVAPEAAVKVYLDADATTRAQRRTAQDGGAATQAANTEVALRERDAADATRTASPLQKAPDAVVIDSSTMTIDEVVQAVLDRTAAVSA